MKTSILIRGTAFGLCVLGLGLSACEPREADELPAGAPAAEADMELNRLNDTEREAGWELLFDGERLDGWRGYRQEGVPSAWEVRDGALHLRPGQGEGGDLITEQTYDNFELMLEWKIAPGGNSGIMYRVVESDDYGNTYHTGPEYQVIDDTGYPDALTPDQKTAANYALHAPARDVTKPAGEWNQTRILVNGPHVEHWLNGEKVVEYELWSEDWQGRVQQSKFTEWPDYGLAQQGHIALQDHGDEVWFRNIRIRPL